MASFGNRIGSRRNAARSAASFMEVYESYEPRMRWIVDELFKVQDYVFNLKMILFLGGAGFGAAAVLALLSAPLTEGWSLIIIILLVGFAPFFLRKQLMADEESVGKVSRLIEEFRKKVFSLNSELEDVKSACGDLRRESLGAEALKFIRLEMDIQKLWALNETLQTPTTLRRLLCDYKNILSRFLQMKTKLQKLEENHEENTDGDEGPAAPPTGVEHYPQVMLNWWFPPSFKRT